MNTKGLTPEQAKEVDALITKFRTINSGLKITLVDGKVLTYIQDEKYFWAKAETLLDLRIIIHALNPNSDTLFIAGSAKDYRSDRRYAITIVNICQENQFTKFEFQVQYKCGNSNVRITMPINFIETFVGRGLRNLSDNEYHYFIGVSNDDLRNMQVARYGFPDIERDRLVNWAGGNQTLLEGRLIDRIMDHLLNENP